jgi:hypothetical protein
MLGLSAQGANVEFHLKNVGEHPLDVLSHVSADIDHLDWYALRMVNQAGRERVLRFVGDRDKSGSVEAHLAPGDIIHHSVNLGQWAKRPVNGEAEIEVGRYQAWAVYEVSPPGHNWTGKLEAGPVTLAI